jgi:predicted small secreted protein
MLEVCKMEKITMKKVLGILAVFAALNLTACNTMSGLGKDVSKLGDKIENKADEHK